MSGNTGKPVCAACVHAFGGRGKNIEVIDAMSKYNFNMDFQQIKITEKKL